MAGFRFDVQFAAGAWRGGGTGPAYGRTRAVRSVAGVLGHLDCDTGDLDFVVEAGVGHPGQHLAHRKVRVGDDVAHVVDRRERHLAAEMLQQLLLGALPGEGRDGGDDRLLVGASVLHGDSDENVLADEFFGEADVKRGPTVIEAWRMFHFCTVL